MTCRDDPIVGHEKGVMKAEIARGMTEAGERPLAENDAGAGLEIERDHLK